MTIRQATATDLPCLADLAREFYSTSKFLQGFQLERFVAAWTALIESGTGVVFLLVDDGAIAGHLGGVIYPDLYSGQLIATEFFWFVTASQRGGGLRLYRAFEAWAREHGASQIQMVHLMDSMPEKLERVYTRLGFEAAEVHYTKKLGDIK